MLNPNPQLPVLGLIPVQLHEAVFQVETYCRCPRQILFSCVESNVSNYRKNVSQQETHFLDAKLLKIELLQYSTSFFHESLFIKKDALIYQHFTWWKKTSSDHLHCLLY